MDGLERCAFCLFSSLAAFFSNGVANLLFTETAQTAPQHGFFSPYLPNPQSHLVAGPLYARAMKPR